MGAPRYLGIEGCLVFEQVRAVGQPCHLGIREDLGSELGMPADSPLRPVADDIQVVHPDLELHQSLAESTYEGAIT